jgi:tellurium resistance protein TerD
MTGTGTSGGVSLVKGQKVDLVKESAGLGNVLKKLTIGLGWDAKSAFKAGADYDLDASAFVLGANGQVLSTPHFVFWGNLKSPEGAVTHLGDNLTGDGDGDDEEIIIELDKVPAAAEKIVFAVNIYEAAKRGQNFGQTENSFIRAVDDAGHQLVKYELDMEAALETTVVFGELVKRGDSWIFSANSSAFPDGFDGLCKQYGVDVA